MLNGSVIRSLAFTSAVLVAVLVRADAAETFPGEATIRIVVPTGPGGPPDIISRLIASEMSEARGWRVVIENRPGALSTIAMAEVLKQRADALSIFPMSSGSVAMPALLPAKGIRLETEFAPVAEIASGYLVLVTHPSVPAKSVAELVALLRAQPDRLSFSSGGFGTPAHLIGELFKLRTDVRATHVPYPGSQPRVADLLNGTTQFAFFNTPAVVDHIATGRVRALAVTAPTRVAALRDVPTVGEQGFPDLLIADWQGFVVKNGSPQHAIAQLNEAVNKALAQQKIRDALARIGYGPVGGTPREFGELIRSQVAYWGKVVADSGIRVQQ
jgi:tripartite-type tricarboxylate transporter receptor subunit TctC